MKTSQWRRAVENRFVFSARLKALSDRSGDRSAAGRLFHVAGPLTAKLHCPVTVWVRGTRRVTVATDRRCWRPEMAVTGTQRSLRQAGSTPWTHFQTIKAVLKTTHWLTGSQCRSSRTGVMCSLRHTPDTIRAAMFCTDWPFQPVQSCSSQAYNEQKPI